MTSRIECQVVFHRSGWLQKRAFSLNKVVWPRAQPSRLNLLLFSTLRTRDSHYSTLNMDIPLLTLHDGNKIPLVSLRVTNYHGRG